MLTAKVSSVPKTYRNVLLQKPQHLKKHAPPAPRGDDVPPAAETRAPLAPVVTQHAEQHEPTAPPGDDVTQLAETDASTAPHGDVIERVATLVRLPVELTVLIFEYLTALDLLKCLRVCKRFHTILDPKSSFAQLTWASYRKRIRLPDPAPLCLSEASFLGKLFGTKCEVCKTNAAHVIWLFRYRICSKCFPNVTLDEDYLKQTLNERQFKFLPSVRQVATVGYDGPTRYFIDSIITDHIPDDEEVEVLTKKKLQIENASSTMPTRKQFETILQTSFTVELNARNTTMYKWILYKFPMLNAKILEELPELKPELIKLKSSDPLTGTLFLQTMQTIIRKNLDKILVHLVKEALVFSSRPASELRDWRTYKAFWKDCLSARTDLPSKEEISCEMNNHAIGLEEHIRKKYKRVRLMIAHAHDLPMKDIEALMETKAFKTTQDEVEFVKACKPFRASYENSQNLNAWNKKYDIDSITAPCLMNQLKEDPIYVAADDEEAFAKLVESFKSKQVALEQRVKDYIREIISYDQVYELVMKATEPDSVYSKFLVSQNYSDKTGLQLQPQIPKYQCCDSNELFYKFDPMFKHVTSKKEDFTKMIIGQEWLRQAVLFCDWMRFTSNLDLDELLFIFRTFSNWVDSDDVFQLFSKHVEKCVAFLTPKRELYQEVMDAIKQHRPRLLLPDSQSELNETLIRHLNITDLGVKQSHSRYFVKNILCDAIVSKWHNGKFFGSIFYKELESLFDKNEGWNTLGQKELSKKIFHLVDKLSNKWTAVDRFFKDYKLDNLYTEAGKPFFDVKFSDAVETVKEINGKSSYAVGELRAAIQNGISLRDVIVRHLKEKITSCCKLSEKLLDGVEEKRIVVLQREGKWVRYSLFELATSSDAIRFENSKCYLVPWTQCFVIGMKPHLLKETGVLDL